MDNNYNGFTPEGTNDAQNNQQIANNQQPAYDNNAYQQPAYANNNAYQQPVYDNNTYQQQYAAPTPAVNDFSNQIAQGNVDLGADGTVAVAKKKSKLPFVIGGTVLGVAGVGALLFAFVAPVKNWVKITFMKPEKYFASVEEQAFSEYSATLSETYGQVVNAINGEGTTVSYSVELSVGDKFMEALKEEAQENGAELPDFTFESLGIDMSVASDSDKAAGANAAITLNGESVISANAVYDIAEQMFYLQIPELSQAYLTASLEEYLDEYTNIDVDIADFDTDSLVSEDEMKRIIEDYANIVYSSIETVEIAKGEKIDIVGKEYSFNVMEYELTEEELYEIVIDVLENAADDDAIIDMVEGFGVEDFDDIIDDAIDDLEDMIDNADDDNYISARVYADARGAIMGREYTVYSDDDETGTFYYIIGADGDDICLEASLEADGEEAFNVEFSRIGSELEGTVEADGEEIITLEGTYEKEAYSGTMTFISPEDEYYEIEEEEVEIGFENVKVTGDNDEYLVGTFFIEIPEDEENAEELAEYGIERIEIVFDSDGDSQEVSLVLGELVSLSVKAAVKDEADINIPDDATNYDIETQIDEYLANVDYTSIVDKVIELLGLDGEYTAEDIVGSIEQYLYGGYDYGYDDGDDDDYDNDWDYDEYYDSDYDYLEFYDEVKINAFAKELYAPLKVETFCAYFGLNPDQMVASCDDGFATAGSSSIQYYNPFGDSVRIADCYVNYLYISPDDKDFIISFNGIGIGSTLDEINEEFGGYLKYGTVFAVNNGEIRIEDYNYYEKLLFEMENGVVENITYIADEEYVLDNFVEDVSGNDDNDDDDSNAGDYEYDYDYVKFDDVTVSVLGNQVQWPCKAETLCAYFNLDPNTMIEAGDYDYEWNDNGSEIDYTNPYDTSARLGDCFIEYLYVKQGDPNFNVTVNNVGIGSTLADINSAFGTEFEIENGIINIEDLYNWDSVNYEVVDGVVVSIYLRGDDDTFLEANPVNPSDASES